MKQQKKPSNFRRDIITIGVTLLLLILLGYGILAVGRYHTKHLLLSAAHEVQLPTNFRLDKTTYQDRSCVDVCPTASLFYTSRDGKNLDTTAVKAEIAHLGYHTNEPTDLVAYKMYKGASLTIGQALNQAPNTLLLSISKE